MGPKSIKKLYYSISEVAEKTGLKPYVLRYWETEFVELRPSKNRAGNRTYKEKDIELIFTIKELLYTKKFTIEGARNYLRQQTVEEKVEESTEAANPTEELISNIQSELEGILDVLNEE